MSSIENRGEHPDRLTLSGFGKFTPEEFVGFLKFSAKLGLSYPPGLVEHTVDPEFTEPQPALVVRPAETEDQEPDVELTLDDFKWTFGRYGSNSRTAKALYHTLMRSGVSRETHETSPYQTGRRYLAFTDVEHLFVADEAGHRALDDVQRVGPRSEDWLRLVIADKRSQIDQAQPTSAEAA